MPYSSFKAESNSSKLRLLLGVVFFSFLAGNINTSSIILGANTVSHVTGNISHLGEFIMSSQWSRGLFIFQLVLMFFLGTIFSGFLLVGQEYSTQRQYGTVTIIQGLTLMIAAKIGSTNLPLAEHLASFVMGMQNAMMSSYRGMIIRTTHMTGIVTDIGFMIGSRVSGRGIELFKLGLLSTILFSFLIGCCVGYALTVRFGILHFYASGALCLVAGLVYFVLRTKTQPHPE